MYQKGDLKMLVPLCDEALIAGKGFSDGCSGGNDAHLHEIHDNRTEHSFSPNHFYFKENIVYLPHSCNEWVIGGAEQIELMITDLQEMLEKIKGKTAAAEPVVGIAPQKCSSCDNLTTQTLGSLFVCDECYAKFKAWQSRERV